MTLGLAVGAEKFMSDASEVMEMLLKTQKGDEEIADDDPQVCRTSYFLTGKKNIQ